MGILLTILMTLLVIAAIISILLILLQDDQGSGMGLFGSSGQNPFSAGDSLLGRLTRIFGISFLVLCLAVAFIISRFGVNYQALQEAQIDFQNQGNSKEESWFLQNPEASISEQEAPLAMEKAANNQVEESKGDEIEVKPVEETKKIVPDAEIQFSEGN